MCNGQHAVTHLTTTTELAKYGAWIKTQQMDGTEINAKSSLSAVVYLDDVLANEALETESEEWVSVSFWKYD